VALVDQAAGNGTAARVESRDLLQRAAASPQFQKSKRLRDLLLYLGERGLQDPNCTLHEQEIGVDVLGRPPDYDTSHDTLVRVLVSQLRKKLHEHFAEEGRDEPVIIEIPKGSYIPVFRPRTEEFPGMETVRPAPAFAARPLLAGMLAGMALVGLAWGTYSAVQSKRQTSAGGRPNVEAFWGQILGNGQATDLVMSDVNLLEFENLIGRSVPLPEYEGHEFDQLAEQYLPDPAQRAMAKRFINRAPTALPDALMARDLGAIAAAKHVPLNVVSARDLSSSAAASQNIVLLGSFRGNPWVGLFEDQLAFQTDYQETPATVRFINRSPLPGEQAWYRAEWRRVGYCRVVYRPNPKRTGITMLISGSDVISTEGGARFVTSEEWMRQLRQKLGLKAGQPFPYFEVLLRTRIVNNTVPSFELVAYRPHKS
jgi:hypothetical protein